MKTLLVDLMAVPDPNHVGGDGDFFRFPFNTIESVHVVNDRHGPGGERQQLPVLERPVAEPHQRPDGAAGRRENEFIEVRLGTALRVDQRLLDPIMPAD